jgi:hypothetical protein
MSDWSERKVMEGYTDENGQPLDIDKQIQEDAEATEMDSLLQDNEPYPTPVPAPTPAPEQQQGFTADAFNSAAESDIAPETPTSGSDQVKQVEQRQQPDAQTYMELAKEYAGGATDWAQEYATGPMASQLHGPTMGVSTAAISAIMASDPDITWQQANDYLYNRMNQIQQQYPMVSQASDLIIGGIGSAPLAKAYSAATSAGKMAVNVAGGATTGYMAPGVENRPMGALFGAGTGAALSKFTDVRDILSPETSRTFDIVQNLNDTTKPLGGYRGWFLKKEKEHGSYEQQNTWERYEANPYRGADIEDTDKSRTELINETIKVMNEIKSTGDAKTKSIENLGTQFDKNLRTLAKISKDRLEPTDKMADSIKEMEKSATNHVISKFNEGWSYLPAREAWVETPEAGVPLKLLLQANINSRFADANRAVGPSAAMKRAVNAEIADDGRTILNSVIADAVQANIQLGMPKDRAMAAGQFIARNPKIIYQPGLQKAAPPEVAQILRYTQNVNPVYVRDLMKQLFTGYRAEKDQSQLPKAAIRSSAEGSVAYSKMHDAIRSGVAKHYNNADFNRITDEANAFNKSIMLPIKKQISMLEIDKPQSVRDFMAAMKRQDGQVYQGFEQLSQLGLVPDDLIKSARDIQALDGMFSGGKIADMTFDEAVEAFSKRRMAAARVIDNVGKSDPQIRSIFGSLVKRANDIVTARQDFDYLINNTKGKFEKVYKLMPKSEFDIPGRAKQIVEGISGGTKKKFDPNYVDTNAKLAMDAINEFRFNSNSERMADAIERMRRIREVDILNQQPNRPISSGLWGRMGRFAGYMVAPRIAMATDILTQLSIQSARDYTGGKWTRLQPYLIEKALQKRIDNRLMLNKAAVLPSDLANIGSTVGEILSIAPNSPEALEAVEVIRGDNALNAKQKIEAIKKITENGINFNMNGDENGK